MSNDFSGLNKDEIISLLVAEKQKVLNLKEELSLLKQYIFAHKSEKITKEGKVQAEIFTEIEDTAELFEEVPEKLKIKKKPGRKPLPDHLPTEKVVYTLPEEETICPCCSKQRPLIESKPTRELEFIPAKVIVKEYYIEKYGACTCDEFQNREDLPEIIEAKAPKRLIPGGIASPNLIAHIITSKFSDHIPLYRLEKIFRRIDVNITRQNMSNWSLAVSSKCEDVVKHIREVAISGKIINMDETTVQVLNEVDKKPQSKSYMWVLTGGYKDKKVVLYNYSKNRGKETPLKLLDGFSGILQTDGYSGYNLAVKDYKLWHVGCLAHARRKFYSIASLTKKKGKAHKGVEFFSRLYQVDNDLRAANLSAEDFLKKRRELSIPIWREFRAWLLKLEKIVLPDSPLARAIFYTLNQYKNLTAYLKDADISLDNNICENAIRPFCVGRKNWLFNQNKRGALSSATFYSLIETAKINGVEPGKYLSFLLNKLADIDSNTDFEQLMPWNMSK